MVQPWEGWVQGVYRRNKEEKEKENVLCGSTGKIPRSTFGRGR
jgi:hypothetical protein